MILLILILLCPAGAWAAFPVVESTATSLNDGNSATNVTSHVVTMPAGVAAGNLILVLFVADTTPTITWPANWNQIVFVQPTGFTGEARYKISDGTEGASITVTTSVAEQSAHITYRISGHNSGTAPTGTITTAAATSVNPNPPAHNPATWDSEDTLWLAGFFSDNGSAADAITAAPTNYASELMEQSGQATTAGVGVGSAQRDLAAASDDPDPFTISASRAWRAFTIAVRPAGAAAPSSVRRAPVIFQ